MGINVPAPTQAKPATAPKRWTQNEFHQLPEGPPYYELEGGRLIEMPRPRIRHQKIVAKLLVAISTYLEGNKQGELLPEIEVDITPGQTYVPDLIFLATENLERIEDDQRVVGPPDLVVEVSSPSTATRDQTTKFHTYQLTGVDWYWLVDSKTLVIHEYKQTADGYLVAQVVAPGDGFTPGIFPDLTVNLAELMGELEGEATGETEPTAEEEQHE